MNTAVLSPRRGYRNLATESKALLHWARRPTLDVERAPRPIRTTASIYILALTMTFFVAVPVVLLATWIYEAPTLPDDGAGLIENLLLAAVAAPIFEELSWRLWLSARQRIAFIGAGLMSLWVPISLEGDLTMLSLLAGIGSAIGVLAIIAALMSPRGSGRSFRPEHTPVLVWLVAFAFALAHLTNFADSFDNRFLWMVPLMVAPSRRRSTESSSTQSRS